MEKFSKKVEEGLSPLCELRVKGFDELYSEVRKDVAQKFIDLGEKLRIGCSSDLSRVQLLVTTAPLIVTNFQTGILESYEGKSHVRSEQFYNKSKTRPEDLTAIDELNNAIRLNPYSPNREDLTMTESLNEQNLKWFLGHPVQDVMMTESDPEESNDKELLSKIYMERAHRFQGNGDHESCILDIFVATAIKFRLEKTLLSVYMMGESFHALGRILNAQHIFQHYLQLLSQSSHNNEYKSVQTLKVVKQLKDIKSSLTKDMIQM